MKTIFKVTSIHQSVPNRRALYTLYETGIFRYTRLMDYDPSEGEIISHEDLLSRFDSLGLTHAYHRMKSYDFTWNFEQIIFLTPTADGKFEMVNNPAADGYNHIVIKEQITKYIWANNIHSTLNSSIFRDPLQGPAVIEFNRFTGDMVRCCFSVPISTFNCRQIALNNNTKDSAKVEIQAAYERGEVDVEYYINVMLNIKKWQDLL